MTVMLALVLAVTAGWENLTPYPEVSLPAEAAVWRASDRAEDFDVERLDGAEGTVEFRPGGLRIVKTNDRGTIRVTSRAPAVPDAKGRYRVTARVATTNTLPLAAKAYVRIGPRPRRGEIPVQRTLDGRTVGGHQKLSKLVNVPSGLRETVCANVEAKAGEDLATSICVKDGACDVLWTDWRVDSFDALSKAEREAWSSARGRKTWSDLVDDAAFAKMLANDVEHTARMTRDATGARFLVDGRETPLALYKCGRTDPDREAFTYGGKAMADAGLTLQVCNVRFGGTPWKEGAWTAGGFDAAAAVEPIRCAMRTATNALFAITVRLDAPKEFSDAHPDEVWKDPDGRTVYGNVVHVTGTEPQRNSWPWMSIHSPAWRSAVKRNLAAFVAELKRTGLSKRVVGIHFGGYHDAQFATARPDCSPCARAAFAASGEKDYVRFLKLAAMRLQDELGRDVRAAFGKDIVVFRWCMAAFGRGFISTYDFGAFAESENVDVIVPQPSYHHRTPGHAISTKLPFTTFLRHGKMLCNELDLRTYAVRPKNDSPIASAGVSRARTPDEWRTIDRKLTGQMLARRCGFWYFDMDGGWFERPEIAADIRDVLRVARELAEAPRTPWRPSVALVIDEDDFLRNQNMEGRILPQDCEIDVWTDSLVIAGIPADQYLASDFDADPSLAGAYRKVFRLTRSARCPKPDALVREVREAGGYVPSDRIGLQVDMNGDFISVHCLVAGAYAFRLPFPAQVVNLRSGKPESVRNQVLPLELTAGETCWFRLRAGK